MIDVPEAIVQLLPSGDNTLAGPDKHYGVRKDARPTHAHVCELLLSPAECTPWIRRANAESL